MCDPVLGLVIWKYAANVNIEMLSVCVCGRIEKNHTYPKRKVDTELRANPVVSSRLAPTLSTWNYRHTMKYFFKDSAERNGHRNRIKIKIKMNTIVERCYCGAGGGGVTI